MRVVADARRVVLLMSYQQKANWTDELAEAISEGLWPAKLARNIGVTVSAVLQQCQKHGVELMRPPGVEISKEDMDIAICDERTAGWAGRAWGVTRRTAVRAMASVGHVPPGCHGWADGDLLDEIVRRLGSPTAGPELRHLGARSEIGLSLTLLEARGRVVRTGHARTTRWIAKESA